MNTKVEQNTPGGVLHTVSLKDLEINANVLDLLSIPNTLAALEAALSQSKEGFSEEADRILSRSFSKLTSLNFNCNQLAFKRKVYLWNKADFTAINELVTQFANSFLENTIDTPIQDLWDAYKTMCLNCLQLVPTKSVPTGKCNQPWATPFIRRLSSKKRRLYNRAKRSDLLEDWKEYRTAKKLMQKECREAHNRYLCNMFDPDSDRTYKNLWSYVKCIK